MSDTSPIFDRTPTGRLRHVDNDTGRTAFCGPYVLAAITELPVSRVEEQIKRLRGDDPEGKRIVKGTSSDEVAAALAEFGFRMEQKASFMHLEKKVRPSLWAWMQKPRNAWAHYILAIHKGRQGHWVLIKGVKLCDTFTEGKWTFVCDGPHKGARIMEVFEVKRAV